MENNFSLCLEASFALPQLGWNRKAPMENNFSLCLEATFALPQPGWNGEAPGDGE
jgi:hypothetical protein